MHLNRCVMFWLWAGVGGALALSVISFVGVLVGLPALVALWLVARRSPRWPEPLGLLTGVGALCLTIAFLNWDELGVDPVPWLAAGVVLGAAGIGFYARARRA
jgi:hypothetical protein